MTKIELVIFDLDNTIYNQDEYYKLALKRYGRKRNISYKRLRKMYLNLRGSKDIFADLLKVLDRYTIEEHDFIFECYKTCKGRLRPYFYFQQTLNFLRMQDIKIAVLTNGPLLVQRNKIDYLKLKRYCPNVFYARYWGLEFEKPHSKGFLHVCKALNINPSKALMVGDSLIHDIDGARAAGLNALLIEKNKNYVHLIKNAIYV
jgi:putative hydrolase of the HAD superfamily